jgi:hypothetical protein
MISFARWCQQLKVRFILLTADWSYCEFTAMSIAVNKRQEFPRSVTKDIITHRGNCVKRADGCKGLHCWGHPNLGYWARSRPTLHPEGHIQSSKAVLCSESPEKTVGWRAVRASPARQARS